MKYDTFRFKSYDFDSQSRIARFRYGIDDTLTFTEEFCFDFPLTTDYDENVLDRALQIAFFISGVSYYKTYVPSAISVESGNIDAYMAAFLSKTYQRGLGEFFYVNKLDPSTPVSFPFTPNYENPKLNHAHTNGAIVAIGGGKDSLVSIELLRNKLTNIATWSVGHRPQLTPLVEQIGLEHFWVERRWDRQLLELNKQGALNGHVPISAVFAAIGTVVSILAGKRDVVVSNEQSANEPTLIYKGLPINHQYSKSQEFEQDYQGLLHHNFGDSLRYYSLLRPMSELRIAEIFAKESFNSYRDVFSSCNRAFVHDAPGLFWCGECAKCAFVFLALTPFIPRQDLEQLWSGKNLLLDRALTKIYLQLLGITGEKPLDCVGEVRESRAAMLLAFEKYPELKHIYAFEAPPNYDFRTLLSHEIPRDIANLVY